MSGPEREPTIDITKALSDIQATKIKETELVKQAQASTAASIKAGKDAQATVLATRSFDTAEKRASGDPIQVAKETATIKSNLVKIQNTNFRNEISNQNENKTVINNNITDVQNTFNAN